MRVSFVIQVLLVLISLAWAGSFIAVKAVTPELDPVILGFLRFLIATPIMMGIVFIQRKSLIWDRALFPWIIILGLTGVTLLYIFQFIGISLTTAATSGVLINTNVLFITLLSSIFLHEALNWKKSLGIMISFIGAVIVIVSHYSGYTFSFSYSFFIGAVMVLLSALCWAIFSIVGKHVLKDQDMIAITTTAFFWGTIFYLPFLPRLWSVGGAIDFSGWSAVLYLALVCSVFAYLGWYYALGRIEASKAAVYLNFIPLFTIILAMVLGEIPSLLFLAGAGLIIYGVYLTQCG